MIEILVLALFIGVFIVPTFYGLYRAIRTEEWGWFAGIALGWVFGVGWLVGAIFLLGSDRARRHGARP
jgi:hypothetical protein